MSGSLDHVLANDAALDEVTGVDIWEINANESLAYEYSRFNYNVTQFYSPDVFRASDHNPELVGVDVRDASDVALTLSPSRIKQKKQTSTATVTVTGEDGEATGTVRFLVDGVQVARRALLDGTASIQVGPFAKGSYQVTVDYLGDDDNLPGSDTAHAGRRLTATRWCRSGPARRRAACTSARWLNACGKLPAIRCPATSYSSASRPTSLGSAHSRSISAFASSMRPAAA